MRERTGSSPVPGTSVSCPCCGSWGANVRQGSFVGTRIIHLVNPKTDSLTTRPIYFNRALYSPLAGLLAVAATIPRDKYEVVLTDENIERVDFELKADLVGISAMTSYVNRGHQIADDS